ncbi:GNAT family N-acetyltransferase [Radiobacillus kanasensis]|uniref:GNAT family N-acetyltransferase n=1 Tax=Radiobacillus kanasensis TaxID=2844358 RepID=UPI001E3DD0F6|nr:GNAT family N-acetyltransferase [Radiobacillus kanasensis]UFU00910.1 GNAT family N-acetyltransferase [Radiobacillus kanasensis]
MIIRELTASDYDKAIDLGEYAFNRVIPDQEREERKVDMANHKVLGYWEKEQLAAKLHIRPLKAFLGSTKMSFGGIAGVATWPEFRRQGKVEALIKESLLQMKQENQVISLLHPFSIGFYRRFGWDITQYEHTYTFKPADIAKKNLIGRTERVSFSDKKDIIMDLYERKAKQFGLTLVRTEWWWEKRILTGDEQIVLYWDENQEPGGYLISCLEKEKLSVEEMVFFSEEAFHGLMQWVRNHDSMIESIQLLGWPNEPLDYYLEGGKVDCTVHPYFMTRIVDLFPFLMNYPFFNPKISCSIELDMEDSYAPWNEGKWAVEIEGGEVVAVSRRENSEATLTLRLTIQTLAAWLFGSQPIELLLRMNQIVVTGNKEDLLSLAVPQPPAFLDYF